MLPLVLFVAGLNVSSEDLVREVVLGHHATLDSIRTFSAKVSFADADNARLGQSARYHRDGDRVSIHDGSAGQQLTRFVIADGRMRQLSQSWVGTKGEKLGGPRSVGAVWLLSEPIFGVDAWVKLVLSFEYGANRYGHLETAVGQPDANPAARSDEIDGRRLIRLTYTCHYTPEAGVQVTTWHDPARGYLVVRRVLNSLTRSGPGSTTDMTDFVQAGGVEFPTKATLTVPAGAGKPAVVQTTTITDLQINRPLPPGTFDLPLPPGIRVTDDVRKSEYVAGADWKPAGPEKPWSRVSVVAPAAPAGGPTQQSVAETRGWTWWLVAASGVLLVVGSIAALVRRASRGRESS